MLFGHMCVLYKCTGRRDMSDKEAVREPVLLSSGAMEAFLAVNWRLICFTPEVKE